MTKANDTVPVLSIKDLRTYFYAHEGVGKAVDGVSYHVFRGETLGVVGESGCGKSVTALSILRLIPSPPGKIVSGEIIFEGQNLLDLPLDKMREIRGNHISMIFQEPMTSLNPVFAIGSQLSKVFILHQNLSKKAAKKRSIEMLEACEIPSPERIMREYPHQLSGGMRQRAMIAMALGCNPEVLIADEPTTALDVTIQAQILDLILRLKSEFGMAMILITHNLGIVAKAARRVVVMYAGEKVEEADVSSLFERPRHPYTIALMNSIPVLGRSEKFLEEIKGAVPTPYRSIPGCKFADRCPEAMERCQRERPQLKETGKGHLVACFH
ncbi:MAG: ABC transporter ATP-binding protein [Desulfobacteraceae bacterium]|jgi:oligopeptide/dipeptide ABC transporter ATP-binding protein|nr:ABC transporter ATP-binding protein [Desulfobacteraceae bacterium]